MGMNFNLPKPSILLSFQSQVVFHIGTNMSEEDEENAAELQFGPEFTDKDVQFLTNDEVFFLLLKKVKSGQPTE